MTRLPIPGSDDNTWGEILNDFLEVEHNADGTLKKATTYDAHIADQTIHRQINDSGTGTTDLLSASKVIDLLDTKSDLGHTHVAADVTDFTTAADARITTQKGAANGLATLGSDSKLTSSQLPTLTKSSVGLGNVDNTSDASKPVSTAQQSALDLKANISSIAIGGSFTGSSSGRVLLSGTNVFADNSGLVFTGSELDVTGGVVATSVTTTNDYVVANAVPGDIGYSSATKTWRSYDGIGDGALRKVYNADVTDGTTVSNTAETSLYSSAVTIGANAVYAGRVIRFDYFGIISTAASSPGTLTIKVKAASTLLITITTPTLPTSLSNVTWRLNGYLVCRTSGASGTMEGYGAFTIGNETTGAAAIFDQGLAHNITVDTSGSMNFSVTATFSASGNSITARSRVVEV